MWHPALSRHIMAHIMGSPITYNLPGDLGAVSSQTAIDLTKPGDRNMVLRAIRNGWEVPQHIKDQISNQLGPVMSSVTSGIRPGDTRSNNQFFKLVKLMLAMTAENMIAEGVPKSAIPQMRRRYPDWRQCSRRQEA